MSYGAQIKFGLAKQTAGATPVDPVASTGSYHGMPLLSEDVGLTKAELISANLIGRFDQGAVYSGVANVDGTISFEFTPKNLLVALAACVNWNPPNVSSGSIGTHTFMPNTVDYSAVYVKAPWTIYKQFSDANSAEQFYDCQFGALEMAIKQGTFAQGKLTLAGGLRSANGVGSAGITPLAADVGVLFPWSVGSLSYGGNALSTASDLTITLNENVDALYTINGSILPFKFTRKGFREVTVKGTFYMTDRSMLNNFTTDTIQRLLVTLINTRTAIQSGYYNTFTIDIPQMKVTQFKPGASGPGEVSVAFQARGTLDPASYYSIQFTTVTTWQGGF